MKKFIVSLVAFCAVLNISAQEIEPKPEVDSVLIGHHFADKVEVYSFQGEYDVRSDGFTEEYEVRAMMLPTGEFIMVMIDGIEIVSIGDDPVLTLPRPIEGTVEQLWLFVDGLNENRKSTCYGYTSISYPEPGEVINISLYVRNQGMVLTAQIPEGINPADTYMVLNDGSRAEYSVRDGGYYVYMSTVIPNQSYEIWHNGTVVATGVIDSNFETVPDQVSGMQFQINIPGNVEVVDMNDHEVTPLYQGLTTAGGQTTLIDGKSKEAKVFTIIQDERQSGLSVELSGLSSASFTVFARNYSGELLQISETVEISSQWGWTSFDLEVEDYKSVILVVTDVDYEDYFINSFEARFYRYYGGGGKG
jgi:hypothetical protein